MPANAPWKTRKPAWPQPHWPPGTPPGGSTASTPRAPREEYPSRGAAANRTRCSPNGRSATPWPGQGKRAIVPGCGLGADAEYLAGLGFAVTAFDVSPTAIRLARQRHPGSTVGYVCADLLHPPQPWLRAFDLVAEIITVQALPRPVRQQAAASVAQLTAPGGTLLVIAAIHDRRREPQSGPPWPVTRAELDAFATDGLTPQAIEVAAISSEPAQRRWRAEFHRPR
jgi:ubiquinone/menaquinone biosynthesis C-methylase UbiE